jgi:hypothetical protein
MTDDLTRLVWIEETLGQAQISGDWIRLTRADELWLVARVHQLQAERTVLRGLFAAFAYLRFARTLVWSIQGQDWPWQAVEKAYQECLSATTWRNREEEWRWIVER